MGFAKNILCSKVTPLFAHHNKLRRLRRLVHVSTSESFQCLLEAVGRLAIVCNDSKLRISLAS